MCSQPRPRRGDLRVMCRRESSTRRTWFGCRWHGKSHIRLVNGQAHPGAPADVRRGSHDLEREERGFFGTDLGCECQNFHYIFAFVDEWRFHNSALRTPVQAELALRSDHSFKTCSREAYASEVSLALPSVESCPCKGTHRSRTQNAEHLIGTGTPSNARIPTTKHIASQLTTLYRLPHVYDIPDLIPGTAIQGSHISRTVCLPISALPLPVRSSSHPSNIYGDTRKRGMGSGIHHRACDDSAGSCVNGHPLSPRLIKLTFDLDPRDHSGHRPLFLLVPTVYCPVSGSRVLNTTVSATPDLECEMPVSDSAGPDVIPRESTESALQS